MGQVDRLRGIGFLNALVAKIKPEDKILKPGRKRFLVSPFREREFLLKTARIMDTSDDGQPEEQNPLADGRDDGIFDRMAVLFATECFPLFLVVLRPGMGTFGRINTQLGTVGKGGPQLLNTGKLPAGDARLLCLPGRSALRILTTSMPSGCYRI